MPGLPPSFNAFLAHDGKQSPRHVSKTPHTALPVGALLGREKSSRQGMAAMVKTR